MPVYLDKGTIGERQLRRVLREVFGQNSPDSIRSLMASFSDTFPLDQGDLELMAGNFHPVTSKQHQFPENASITTRQTLLCPLNDLVTIIIDEAGWDPIRS